MNFLPDGYPFLVGMTLLAAITFALALRLRSWPLWLAAFGFVLLAILIAWFFRDVAPLSATVVTSSCECVGADASGATALEAA